MYQHANLHANLHCRPTLFKGIPGPQPRPPHTGTVGQKFPFSITPENVVTWRSGKQLLHLLIKPGTDREGL